MYTVGGVEYRIAPRKLAVVFTMLDIAGCLIFLLLSKVGTTPHGNHPPPSAPLLLAVLLSLGAPPPLPPQTDIAFPFQLFQQKIDDIALEVRSRHTLKSTVARAHSHTQMSE